ncbi:MAG: response regulator [Gluconacetobacter diazotrophicus]|nr:response regulator [Gluconacetobacter diazotrophicus]
MGVGSTFTVEFAQALPLDAAPVFEPIAGRRAPSENADATETRHKVLYIEDDPLNLELIERLLSLDGSLRLLTATCGQDGLEIAREQRPELVLLDMHLTDMDGAEVLGALRSDARTAQVPVVVVSADAMGEQIERMRRLGAQAYITKPLDLDDLRRTISETIHAAAAAG